MERGLDQLGMLGVSMTCSCFDRSTAEAEFQPLYEEMNRRGTVLNYHPIQNGICSPMINDYGFTVSVGTSLEDTRDRAAPDRPARATSATRTSRTSFRTSAASSRCCSSASTTRRRASTRTCRSRPSVTARRFYYDTVGHGSQAALLCAWKAFGADHLVAGSDYPVLLAFETYRQTFHYIREVGLPERTSTHPAPQRPDRPRPAALMDRVRLAIVGCGNISQLNAPGYLQHPRCDVVALCDPIPERAERRARELGRSRRASTPTSRRCWTTRRSTPSSC